METIRTGEIRGDKPENSHIALNVVDVDSENGVMHGFEFLQPLLGQYEIYNDHFRNDSTPEPSDYEQWLSSILKFIHNNSPWFFAATVNDELQGCLWVTNWEKQGEEFYSCEFHGFAFPGVNPASTCEAIRLLTKTVFNETPVYIIRTVSPEGNRAAQIAAKRAGYSHPEKMRAWQVRGGEPITGIISSIIRPEFEADGRF